VKARLAVEAEIGPQGSRSRALGEHRLLMKIQVKTEGEAFRYQTDGCWLGKLQGGAQGTHWRRESREMGRRPHAWNVQKPRCCLRAGTLHSRHRDREGPGRHREKEEISRL